MYLKCTCVNLYKDIGEIAMKSSIEDYGGSKKNLEAMKDAMNKYEKVLST